MDDENRTPVAAGDAASTIYHLIAVGQMEKARERASQLVAENPGNSTAHVVLSQVLSATGYRTLALEAATEALRLDPESDFALFQRAVVLRGLGRFREAEVAFLASISLDPSCADYHLSYAWLLADCERERIAIPLVQRALELDSDNADAHQLLARLLLVVKPRDIAITEETALRAVALDPEDADSHAVLGLVRLRAREFQAAELSFRTALEISPGNALALRGLAETVMAISSFYRPFFAFSAFMQRSGLAMQVAVIGGLWMFVSALRGIMAGTPTWSRYGGGLEALYLAFCGYTWFARPVTRWLLSRKYPWLRTVSM